MVHISIIWYDWLRNQ